MFVAPRAALRWPRGYSHFAPLGLAVWGERVRFMVKVIRCRLRVEGGVRYTCVHFGTPRYTRNGILSGLTFAAT